MVHYPAKVRELEPKGSASWFYTFAFVRRGLLMELLGTALPNVMFIVLAAK
jgi:hypothetical protein